MPLWFMFISLEEMQPLANSAKRALTAPSFNDVIGYSLVVRPRDCWSGAIRATVRGYTAFQACAFAAMCGATSRWALTVDFRSRRQSFVSAQLRGAAVKIIRGTGIAPRSARRLVFLCHGRHGRRATIWLRGGARPRLIACCRCLCSGRSRSSASDR